MSSLESEILRLRKQLRYALSGDLKLKTRLKRLEKSFGQVKENTIEVFRNAKDKQSLKLAKTLMRKGAAPDELVELCGLSSSEANILQYMEKHRGARRVNTAPAASSISTAA